MKPLKLIVVFAGLLALALVIVFGSDITDLISDVNHAPTGEGLQYYHRKVAAKWEKKRGWDRETFLTAYSYCKVCGVADEYRDLLHTQNADSAAGRIYAAALAEWAKPACGEREIARLVGDIDSVAVRYNDFKQRADMQRTLDINARFIKALELVRHSYEHAPDFRRQNNGWTPYVAYADSYRQQRDAIQRDTLYTTYLKNIREIDTGLNQMNDKLAKAKRLYYTGLTKQILQDYERIEQTTLTQDHYNELSKAIGRVRDQDADTDVSKLKTLLQTFEYCVAVNKLYTEYSRIPSAARRDEQAQALAKKAKEYAGKMPSNSAALRRLQNLAQQFEKDAQANNKS